MMGEHSGCGTGKWHSESLCKMNTEHFFQDVNISELMKKLDILGDNGVTMTVLPGSVSFLRPGVSV